MTPLGCIRVKMTLTAHACLVVLSGGYIHPPGKYPPTHPVMNPAWSELPELRRNYFDNVTNITLLF